MSGRLVVVASPAATTLAVATSSAWGRVDRRPLQGVPIPTANSEPRRIAAGATGNIWFTEFNADASENSSGGERSLSGPGRHR